MNSQFSEPFWASYSNIIFYAILLLSGRWLILLKCFVDSLLRGSGMSLQIVSYVLLNTDKHIVQYLFKTELKLGYIVLLKKIN